MVLWIIACVETIGIVCHVFVDVIGGNVVAQAIRVVEEQSTLWIILLHVVVVELIHEQFAEF